MVCVRTTGKSPGFCTTLLISIVVCVSQFKCPESVCQFPRAFCAILLTRWPCGLCCRVLVQGCFWCDCLVVCVVEIFLLEEVALLPGDLLCVFQSVCPEGTGPPQGVSVVCVDLSKCNYTSNQGTLWSVLYTECWSKLCHHCTQNWSKVFLHTTTHQMALWSEHCRVLVQV